MDFDTAKENIQPLRGGRNVHTLETALHAENDVETQQKLAETRRQFEEAIIAQSQDEDPLEPWYEYITWLEQSYPKSGKESTLDQVLVKCIEQFQQDKRYRQDRRMIKLYIKFIDGQADPQDYFQDLYNDGIGTMVSDLYIAWAYYYDIVENFKQAETVFRKGLDAGAQPYDELVQAHKNFNFSVSQRMFYSDEDSKQQWKSSMAEQRNALTSLRAHKKRYVASQRTGGVVKSHLPGVVNQENRSANVAASNASIQVYDESHGGDRGDVTIGGNRTMQRSIVDMARSRENAHEPGPWTNLSKNEKKKGRLFESRSRPTLGFSIAEDDDDEVAPESQNISVLVENFSRGIQLPKGFVRKNQPQTELKVATMIVDPEEKVSSRILALPMYNKSFLYPKPDLDFAPEELRGYYWFKRHGIENKQTKVYDSFWANSYECGVRLPADFVAKNLPQTDKLQMTPFVPDKSLKFALNVTAYYPPGGGEEQSYDEQMAKHRWAAGKIKRYESLESIEMDNADEMDVTNIGPRRMSVYPLRLTHNRRTTVLPPTFERSTEDAESEVDVKDVKDVKAPMAMEDFKIFQDTPVETKPSTGAIRKSVFGKRCSSPGDEDALKRTCIVTTPVRMKTRFELEDSDDLKMPPPLTIPLTKTPAIPEPVEPPAPEPRFEIFQDEPEPPKSRPTTQFFNPNDSCSTQTFNFFIKSQSVSTPKACKMQKSTLATIEDQYVQPLIHSKASIYSPPEQEHAEQDNQTPPLTVNTLANKQLSTIMETTETNTMSSAVTTKSSVDQGSSPEDCHESHHVNKTHQTTRFTSISEKIRTDMSVLHKDVSCDDRLKSLKFSKPLQEQSERHTTVSSSMFPPASFKAFEDRTETVPVMPSFKLSEDRTETGPVAPSFNIFEDRTETVPVMPSFKLPEDRTENGPMAPSFRTFEDRTETIHSFKLPEDRTKDGPMAPSFKIFEDCTENGPVMPSLKMASERTETLPVLPSFHVAEDATQTMPKMPPQMPFTVFEDHTETVPKMPICKSTSFMPAEKASATASMPTVQPFQIFEDTATPKVSNAARASIVLEPHRVATPDPADMLDLFAKTPEKPGKTSAFDYFAAPTSNLPQTPKKSLVHQKEYVLFKPEVAKPPAPEKDLSLSFSDFQSDEKILIPDSFVADKSVKVTNHNASKIPVPQHDVSLNRSAVAKSSVSRMFSTSRTVGKLFEPALSKSIASQSFMSATPLHSDVSGRIFSSKDTTTPPISSNKFEFALPSAPSPPIQLRTVASARETSPATFASALEDDCINTERFCLNLQSIQNSTLLPEKLIATAESVERTLSQISISASTESAVTGKTVIDIERTLVDKQHELDLSCSLDETEMQMLADSKIKQQTCKAATLKPQQPIIQIDETQADQNTLTDGDAHAEALGVSIYVPRQPSADKLRQYDDQWEEIDETFVPGMDYNHAVVDLDQTRQTIQDLKGRQTINPFDKKLCCAMLEEIEFKKYIEDNLPSCVMLNLVAPLKKGVLIDCRTRQFEISKLIGSGGYGTVFSAKCTETDKMYAVKQERPCNLWEFYVCLELQSRLSNINPSILKAFMNVEYSIIAHNASILISELSPHGNILDVCNKFRGATNKNLDEYIVMMIVSQMLLIIDHLHACNIIHADVKPDNFLVMRRLDYGSKQVAIQLIDFGVAIDMNMFEENTTFKYASKLDTFTCIEMREKRPWTYQTDLFGVAGSAHVMLFGKYMEVEKRMVNWHIKSKLPRYFNKSVWDNFFATLLNVRDCRDMPNLQTLRYSLDEAIAQKEKYVKEKVVEFNKCL